MSADFVHLHNHTTYSLLDGATRIGDLVEACKREGMRACAITDHGNLFGTIEFYQAMQDAGLRPIIGSEVYVAVKDRHSRESARGIQDGAHHFVLLARNETGYKNLMKLSSASFLEGFYYHPRIDRELLEAHHEGIIALSACLRGEVNHLLIHEGYEGAREAAAELRDLFGPENFFIELQDHGISDERKIHADLIKLAGELGVGLVATNDCHYLRRDHAHSHEVLLCIQTGKTLHDQDRLVFSGEEAYVKSPQEMREIFGDVPEALRNTVEIAERCELEIEFGASPRVAFTPPEGFATSSEYLAHLAQEGLVERYGEAPPSEARARLETELGVIGQMGLSDYFLTIWDLVREAKVRNIPVGPGRGSAAGCLVSYVLGTTSLDPLTYGLFFERFVNPERLEPPDFDIDLADRDRGQMIDYVVQKYGAENVAQIITFGTMAAKGVIRDVGRALGMPYGDVDRIARLVPGQIGITLDRAMEMVPELRQLSVGGGPEARLLEHARILEGLARHASTHAAGVVIAPEGLDNYVPLYKPSRSDEVMTQYSMNHVMALGLLKIDFLGLRTLTVIEDAAAMIRVREPSFNPDHIPLDDAPTFAMVGRGETVGIFQFESSGMREYLRKLKPDSLEDMIAMNALYRPGPMARIDEYIARKRDPKLVTYDHPLLEPILEETYGIIVYQEQVMRIANVLAGFSLGEADVLRKAMGKKQRDLMAKMRDRFMEGCRERDVDEQTARRIFDAMEVFSGYGFNKSHSAPYAYLAYQTAYLKANYPAEFLAASLTSEADNTDRVGVLVQEGHRMGLALLPPDVNKSRAKFAVEDGTIRYGLAAVRNVGAGLAESVIAAREDGEPFASLVDLCERADPRLLNKRALESLIYAGTLDGLGGHRRQLVDAVGAALGAAQASKRDRERQKISLFGTDAAAALVPVANLPQIEPMSALETLEKEKEALGFYLSGHPLDTYYMELSELTTHALAALDGAADGQTAIVGGRVTQLRKVRNRSDQLMAFFTLEDFTGSAEIVIFSRDYGPYQSVVMPDAHLIVEGRIRRRDEGSSSVVAERIWPLEQVREKLAGALNLRLLPLDLDADACRAIENKLQSYPGDREIAVVLHVPDDGGPDLALKTRRRLSLDDALLDGLKDLDLITDVWIS